MTLFAAGELSHVDGLAGRGTRVTSRVSQCWTAAATVCAVAVLSACAPDHHPATGKDDGKVTYTTNDRVVFPGTSVLGWSCSRDGGNTWPYGEKVNPPNGIAALWGDPAIVVSRSYSYSYSNRIYITSLAINAAKIPAGEHHGWMDDGTITGACVARSDDGGIHSTGEV